MLNIKPFYINKKDKFGQIGIKYYATEQGLNSTYINQEELKQLIEFLTNQLEK